MKRIIALVAILFLLCSCTAEINKTPIDKRIEPAHYETITEYKYQFVWFGKNNGFVYLPYVYDKYVAEQYMVEYLYEYENGNSKTRWETVSEDEYNSVEVE